ncbi:arrestin domain-containing protein 1 isoform X2 [Seriola dumerili]|uniref:arrestin domain-containing protein 1 isoform X2 n=1 Tax=Seriola dumerili TaxID=41447 RepID=UPI000BBEAE1F|nr:arrestin domain-containing protein 1 isoform X2 [Seriola dumerili]
MGKLQEFDITFTNNKVVYGPGESISGTVKIRTSNSLQYKAIKVNCQGSCGISNKMNDASWSLEEQYFNSTLSVADKGTLAAGEHSFPFQFLIPVAVPTSFEGPFGKIIYRVRAAIDTPRFSKDYKAQRPFYLLNLLNLNEVPDIEKVTYKTKRPLFDLRTIAEVEGAGVKAGKHAEWREQIIVPPLPQSALAGCSLIDIDYFIQVSLKSPDAVVTLPIYIGNIAVNLSPSRTIPSSPEHCGATIAPRAAGVTPSAPPAEEEPEEGLCAGGLASEEIPTKSHSQQDPSGQPVTMSPSAFSHAPGAALPPSHRRPDASAPLFCVSTGATIPFFTEGNVTPVPTSCSLILPPEYSSWDYPHEPPPSYEESCSSANSSFNSRQ